MLVIRNAQGREVLKRRAVVEGSPSPETFSLRGPLGTYRIILKGEDSRRETALRLDAETRLITASGRFDSLVPRIRYFLANDTTTYYINGRVVHGYRSPDTTPIWLRDHTHQMKGFKYFDPEVISAIDYFLQEQRADGSLWDYVVLDRDEGIPFGKRQPKHARCEVEADVEYLGVEAAFQAWQCTGNDTWLKAVLPSLEKAVHYTLTDPWRWSAEHGLVKRPYTVDTWDYEYNNCDPWVLENTCLGLMHGDNSGLYQALLHLALLEERCGDLDKALRYREDAKGLRSRANRLLWNGRFYTHFVPLRPIDVPGVNVKNQLSLSNPYDINRGLPTHAMAVKIIKEYQRRLLEQSNECFAEWHSIDPPFPSGSFQKGEYSWTRWAGQYTNGGILPLVGGELAHAAFEHGEEYYGIDILERYARMVEESGETYLWYHRDGRPGRSSDTTLPTDGWGSAAMLYALMEGLAGIVDDGCLFNTPVLSPRWAAAGEREAYACARYAASDAYVAYQFQADSDWREINLRLSGSGGKVRVRLLLPERRSISAVLKNGKSTRYRMEQIQNSLYCVCSADIDSDICFRLSEI